MIKTILIVIGELGFAVVAGWITSFYFINQDFSFIFGLGTFIALQLATVIVISATVRETISRLSLVTDLIKNGDSFTELAVVYAIRSASFAKDKIDVQKDDVLELWKECISRIRSKWIVLSYATPEDCWNLTWGAKHSLAIQNERIKANCQIQRIFLVDSDKDIDKLRSAIAHQKEIDITVKWLTVHELLKNRYCKQAVKELNTFDVAVADESWVFMTFLDRSKNIVSARATRSSSLLKAAKKLLSEAEGMSHDTPKKSHHQSQGGRDRPLRTEKH